MAKKRELAKVKVQIPGGQANPAPPIGPALGQHGVNIMEFCRSFNEKTKDQPGLIIPAIITVYSSTTSMPIDLAEPAIIDAAASRSAAFSRASQICR